MSPVLSIICLRRSTCFKHKKVPQTWLSKAHRQLNYSVRAAELLENVGSNDVLMIHKDECFFVVFGKLEL